MVQPYPGSFVTASDPATGAPVLVRSNPVAYSSGNPINLVLELEFSEALSPASVTSANVFVRDPANQPVAGTLSLRGGNRIVRFTPAANFPPSNYNYFYYQGLSRSAGRDGHGQLLLLHGGRGATRRPRQ